MLNLDSVKIQFPLNSNAFIRERFNKTIRETDNNIDTVFYKAKKNYLCPGVNEVTVNESDCIIALSSKLLPELYQDMFNINTAERYLEKVIQLGLLPGVSPAYIIEHSKVLTCDVTNNMKVLSVPGYVNALCSYKLNNKYKVDWYPGETIIFDRKVKTNSFREHLTVYNKYPELLTARNKNFRKEINIQDYKYFVRFESRFTTFQLMKRSFNTPDTSLINILNSKEKVNYNILNRITDISSISIDTFNNYKTLIEMKEKLKHSKIRNITGDLSILESCNNDIDLVKLYFKTNSNANNSRYIRYFKQLLKAKNEIDQHSSIDEKVNEMKSFLRVS